MQQKTVFEVEVVGDHGTAQVADLLLLALRDLNLLVDVYHKPPEQLSKKQVANFCYEYGEDVTNILGSEGFAFGLEPGDRFSLYDHEHQETMIEDAVLETISFSESDDYVTITTTDGDRLHVSVKNVVEPLEHS